MSAIVGGLERMASFNGSLSFGDFLAISTADPAPDFPRRPRFAVPNSATKLACLERRAAGARLHSDRRFDTNCCCAQSNAACAQSIA